MATLVVVQSTGIPSDQIEARVHEANTARSKVEQAKGILAHVCGIDMSQAYDALRVALTQTALRVVREPYESES